MTSNPSHASYGGHPSHSTHQPYTGHASHQGANPSTHSGHASHPPQQAHASHSGHAQSQVPQHYKEIPNQNFIEVRLRNKNIREISKEDALQKYKRNAYIIGRIFSYPLDDNGEDLDDNQQGQPLSSINEESIKSIEEEITKLKEKHNQRLEDYKQRNQTFSNIMNDLKNIKSHQELNDVVGKVKKENFYAYEHPFFNEASPFYFRSDDSIMREVPNDLKASSWNESENLHIYQL